MYLYFARVEVALEVCGVVVCVPQAPFNKTCEFQRLFLTALVGDCHFLNFAVKILRNKELNRRFNAVLFARDYRITQAVTAFVFVKLGFYGAPTGIPNSIAVLDVEIPSAHINGNVVVTITRNAAQTRVLVKTIAARRVGNQ